MKKYLTLFSLFLFSHILAQKKISYEEIGNIKGEITLKNSFFDSYLSKDGKIFKIGDTLTLGKPSGPDYIYYKNISIIINKFKKNKTYLELKEGFLFVIELINLTPSFRKSTIEGRDIVITINKRPYILLLGKMICKECDLFIDKYSIEIEEAIKYGEIDFVHNADKPN